MIDVFFDGHFVSLVKVENEFASGCKVLRIIALFTLKDASVHPFFTLVFRQSWKIRVAVLEGLHILEDADGWVKPDQMPGDGTSIPIEDESTKLTGVIDRFGAELPAIFRRINFS